MDASWWVWSLFSLVLLAERVVPQATCDMNYTKSFNAAKQIYECRKCPDNCFSCVDGGANIGVKCSACHHGHFLTQEATCKSCTPNCASCSGETLDRCHDLEPGYFYSSTAKQLVACSEGCISCDATGACSRCKFGYLNIVVRGTENSTMPKYTCQKCQHPNCLFCEVNPFGKQICKHCAFGFGLHPANGFCIPCTEGCAVCSSNSMNCNYCKSGYFKNYTSGACQQYQIENCVNYDPESQKCLGCSSGFAIEPTSGKMCVSCQPIDPHCSRCGLNPANTFSKQMACGDCFRGFFLEQSTQKCKTCSEGCLYCNNENSCLGCMAGYRVLNGKCAQKEPNCTDFLPSGGCTRCQSGSFLQKVNPQDISGVCKPCASTCLECDGEDQNHCTRCAVNRLKVTLDGVKWGSIVFFQERHQCVESCPHGYTPNYILNVYFFFGITGSG